MQMIEGSQKTDAYPVVRTNGLSFARGGVPIVENISLVVNKGEILGIIGPNGGGKTTLLRLILGLEKPTAGEVELFTKPLPEFKDWARIAYVPQHATHFDPNFPATVSEVVLLGRVPTRGLLRWFTAEDRRAAQWAIEHCGLGGYSGRRVSNLSGGEKQRIFIAKALASQAELLIMDEPTTGVDAESQTKFYDLLHDMQVEHAMTIIIVSHDLSVVHTHVQKVACLNRTLVYHGDPKGLDQSDMIRRVYGADRVAVTHDH